MDRKQKLLTIISITVLAAAATLILISAVTRFEHKGIMTAGIAFALLGNIIVLIRNRMNSRRG